jgi:hypothetical protein
LKIDKTVKKDSGNYKKQTSQKVKNCELRVHFLLFFEQRHQTLSLNFLKAEFLLLIKTIETALNVKQNISTGVFLENNLTSFPHKLWVELTIIV